MNTLNEQVKKLDLSNVDIGQICLNVAETNMQDYEKGRWSKNAWTYLHLAETNLSQAARHGKDTSELYEKLRKLQGESPGIDF
ncbi:MAG: hypothetical protein ABH840_02870 [Nanoarchaeota archaeon]